MGMDPNDVVPVDGVVVEELRVVLEDTNEFLAIILELGPLALDVLLEVAVFKPRDL